jgi:nucleotide-binding universal stress UspA family protein
VLVVRTPDLEPIVVADDGSEHARRAEALLAHWPRLPGATVTVVTVIAPRTYWPALPGDAGSVALETYAADMEHARRDAEVEASQAARRLCDAGFDARPELRGGDPASVLVDAAKRHGAGLIVMGTRGHGGIARLLIGSVARNVLLHAPCSVLIARPTRRRVPKVEAAARLAGAAV